MTEWAIALVVFALCFTVSSVSVRWLRPWERRLVWTSLVCHFFALIAVIIVTTKVYGYGDMLGYQRNGAVLGAHLHTSFGDVAPDLLKLLFQVGESKVEAYGSGPTGSMLALAAFVAYAFGGALASSCAVVACFSFLGKLGIYSVLRSELAPRHHKAALIASMLMPSVVYWTSGLLKETVAMSCLGGMIWAGYRVATKPTGKLLAAIVLILLSGLCALIKPYILIPYIIASGAWMYRKRFSTTNRVGKRKSRALSRIAILFATIVFLLGLGRFAPRYDVGDLAESVREEQEAGATVGGGSSYSLGGSGSAVRSILVSPWAVTTAFFRPAIIEARSPIVLANSLETLVLTIMLFVAIRRRGLAGMIQRIRTSPILYFCVAFSLILAVGVGLSTTNLGTLSRYRVPLVPFLAISLAVLMKRDKAKSRLD